MIPYLGNVLNGWTESITLSIESFTIVDFEKVSTSSTITIQGNLQPMPAEDIQRRPEEQWSWKWWSLIVKENTASMKTNDLFTVDGKKFIVNKIADWTRSGFVKYEAIETYEEAST